MYPELFKLGPFTVYSYGLMLGISFIVASWLLSKEFQRRGLSQDLGTEITLLAIVFGIAGSKLLHLFENWGDFMADPLGMAFSPGGLTFHGGLLLAVAAIWLYVKRKKIPFLFIADLAAPSLAIAYGIGRLGCHLAGDGDYGIPTTLPWGTNYENGIVPPAAMFRGSAIAQNYPLGIVPNNTPLHPTPVYEFLGALAVFGMLWYLRKKEWNYGTLFMVYLLLTGVARFLVEFLRLNPHIAFGLSQAQLLSLASAIIGIAGMAYYLKNPGKYHYTPPVVKGAKK